MPATVEMVRKGTGSGADLGVRACIAFLWEAIPRPGELMASSAAPGGGAARWTWFEVGQSEISVKLGRKNGPADVGAFTKGMWAHPCQVGGVDLCLEM